MRFSSPSSSFSSREEGRGSSDHQPSPRRLLRKKHKKLDAICEKEYNRNHLDLNDDHHHDHDHEDDESAIRRSSRVRRAPVLLDVSPPPPKKRRKKSNGKDSKSPPPPAPAARDSEVWRSRLRTRGEDSSPRGKRKVFFDDEADGETGVGKYTVVKSKRPGRVKATNGVKGESFPVEEVESRQDSDLGGDETLLVETEDPKTLDDSEEALENRAELSENESDFMVIERPEKPVKTRKDSTVIERPEKSLETQKDVTVIEQPEKPLETQKDVTVIEQPEKPLETQKYVMVSEQPERALETQTDVTVIERPEKPLETQRDVTVNEQTERPLETQTDFTVNEQLEKPVETQTNVKAKSAELDEECRAKGSEAKDKNTLRRPRIKEGRRCGLCGGGTDGKPPKPSARDNNTGESDNEVYSGSSGPDEPSCYDIWDGFGDEPSWLGRLLGPLNDRYGIAGTWVHQHCAVWSPEVYFAGLGCLKNVRAALYRGRALKCSRCGRPGATIGCRVDRCPKTYHLPCARTSGCIFDHRKFLIACTDHRNLFQPHGPKLLARIKKIKARKLKLEFRKLANEASRNDLEAEEKWFENCGEDEEFLKRESKRLHRDLARIAPVYIGGKNSDNSGQKIPEGWESVAGLQDVIRCMKEVVILPLLYPEFFDDLSLTPPRGVLLHGYPGTGKTLVVRALIGACARGDKRIAYFARKGADCLGKYVGDAERQLRLLFQVAERSQPSIIFFDEIDGLAPRRTGRQDQTHSSVVSTLLALMDGLKSRGSVVVVGATNRPDAVDPALRRPGRFDREIYFPLPSVEDRAAILSLHTRKWPGRVAGAVLERVARETAGFAGADLQALCTQAAMIGLKRNFPLQEILTAAAASSSEERDSGGKRKRLPLPSFAVEERDWLEALSRSPPPCSRREAGTAAADVASSPLPRHLVPCLLRPLSDLLVSLQLDERVSLPSPLSRAAGAVKAVMVSALAKRKKKNKKVESDRWWSVLDDYIIGEDDVAREIETGLRDLGILVGDCYSSIDASGDLNGEMVDTEPYMKRDGVDLLKPRNKSGFRVLIAGSPRSGQRHLASCLVHCFVGNSEIRKVDLATISQEGHGDSVHGITEILSKSSGIGSSVVFMPRIDLWAMETHQQVIESDSPEKDSSNIKDIRVTENENIVEKDATRRASSAWSLFVEHVESICVSSSLTILATAEVPFTALPNEIRDFFAKRTSKDAQPFLAEHTIPRFIVQLDTDFDRDSVIKTSAAKLSRDVVQQLIQSIHSQSHVPKTPSEQYKASDFVENPTTGQGSNDNRHKEEESVPKTLAPPNFTVAKVKSNLSRAISSFGYQILQYPHFAELCWATSKLRDGPSAEVSGPWKRWPFNSCVVSPARANSLETIAIGSNSINVKSKEKLGLVRGLTAVGLSAYRGIYTSLREVSVEVRKVLELLVLLIDEKVRAGKDRYRYFRLLSQVAYLEDKVNTWAYSLQSLEPASSMDIESSKPNSDNASNKVNGSEVVEETPQRLGDEKAVFIDLNKENGDFCHLNNGTHSKPSLSEVLEGHSNGVSRVEDGLGDVSERNLSTQIPDSDNNAKDSNFLRTEATEDLCLYNCCSECLNTLFDLTKKVLVHRLGSDHTSLTVDRVHDVVASLSVDLIRRVTKLCSDETKPRNCRRDRSENGTVATSSSCKCCLNKSHKSIDFAMKFLIRNGVLVHIDGDGDFSSLHCRFESLCLCSLIDSILTMSQISES